MSDRRFKTEDPEFESRLLRALEDVRRVLDASNIPFLAAGAIAMTAYKKGSWPVGGGDIDLLTTEEAAHAAIDALAGAGFHREPAPEDWLVKATRDGVLVDIIFVAGHYTRPDDDMFARGVPRSIAGVPLKAISPEDYVVMQSFATRRAAPNYWFDAVEIVPEIRDWAYLVRRARRHPGRVLSLLAFAVSEAKPVPREVLEELVELTSQSVLAAT